HSSINTGSRAVPSTAAPARSLPRAQRSRTRRSVFFKHTATTKIYTLSLHDALPILPEAPRHLGRCFVQTPVTMVPSQLEFGQSRDRKSTRLNSSHVATSYAVFCLKKKICGRQAVRSAPEARLVIIWRGELPRARLSF